MRDVEATFSPYLRVAGEEEIEADEHQRQYGRDDEGVDEADDIDAARENAGEAQGPDLLGPATKHWAAVCAVEDEGGSGACRFCSPSY